IVKGSDIETVNGRRPYPLAEPRVVVQHFVVRVTTPENPFGPHKHKQPELWYLLEGQARVQLGQDEHDVERGDLVVIEPWIEHGLRTEIQATWICLG
ncbi:MAG: cupin domain-containing protein, partial [Chloroflexota bacterium]